MYMRSRFAAFLGIALLAFTCGVAQAERGDPPSRVARLSYTRGEVSFSPAGEDEWVNATRNRPLIRGDRLWTDRGARAELQAGTATYRLDEGTSFQILNLDDRNAQVELAQGTLNLRVRRIYDAQTFEVDTPTLAFVITRPGEYRIDVDSRGRHTTVAVWDGGGEAYGDGAHFRVREGEAIRFFDRRLSDYEVFDIPRPDEFDRFCMDSDARMDRSVSRRYVSEDLIGYSDLDEYGSWTEVREYGSVWFPSRVSVGWAPYRDGHWIWQEPWGWTWVDDAPWGFAPFHYGRWVHVSNRWGWIPGPISVRPVYAPALVAFVGGHNWHVGVNIGTRPIGWFPLGHREIYVPPYRTSRNYFTNVNVTNTVINNTYITNIYNDYSSGRNIAAVNYHNRQIAGAVTAVPGDAFVNARSVRQSLITLDREAAARAEVTHVAAIAPSSRSVVGVGRAATAMPAREVLQREVVARTAPPPRMPSFSERQPVLQRTPGRVPPPEAMASVQRGDTAVSSGPQRVRVVGPSAGGREMSTQDGRGPDRMPTREPERDTAVSSRNRGPTEGGDRAVPERGGRGEIQRGPVERDTMDRADTRRVERDSEPSARSPVGRNTDTAPERDFTRPSSRSSDTMVRAPRDRGGDDINSNRVERSAAPTAEPRVMRETPRQVERGDRAEPEYRGMERPSEPTKPQPEYSSRRPMPREDARPVERDARHEQPERRMRQAEPAPQAYSPPPPQSYAPPPQERVRRAEPVERAQPPQQYVPPPQTREVYMPPPPQQRAAREPVERAAPVHAPPSREPKGEGERRRTREDEGDQGRPHR
ncbi:DUF6600 domain-containing protein [Tahibacter amnicola]|uniref:FecR domain-containing protein n=1 Tax=Tahibacter amnicola TaxID=2976241 RepID=A0ABY6BLK3_9GAMM|nr:DUF6600 domain-containing protein [Tahibacter amnicola]UXI69265.1 FecR domain-containing protein [Tahibacter amnicola]